MEGCLIIPSHQSGTTWEGMAMSFSVKNELGEYTPVDLTGASIVADFKLGDNRPSFSFKTSDASIVITDPINGVAAFMPALIGAKDGEYNFNVLVELQSAKTEGMASGYWEITKQQPKCA